MLTFTLNVGNQMEPKSPHMQMMVHCNQDNESLQRKEYRVLKNYCKSIL